MAEQRQLHHPWLVAVWPGMGHVALNAGVYLLAKLGMDLIAEFAASDLFDVDHVEVKDGIIQPGKRPRNRLFVWADPNKKHDLAVFLGEAQPPIGKYAFCRQLISNARQLGVERIFTFAAMATPMHPEQRSRLFGAATDEASLEELKQLELEILNDGHIGGLNGVLLGAAAEAGLRGACLLGEMPHLFTQLPFPKASLVILEAFTAITGIDLDLGELSEQAKTTEQQLGGLLARMEQGMGQQPEEEEEFASEATDEPNVDPADSQRIEQLFQLAIKDRSKAFELKQELDRLGLFKEYEDRFLDLFKQSG
ncbi:MAG TPA: PAC2 family protein [Gemmataceae bacterium]|nr:PAC2 family protein [Gemmataceae bacterium]